MVNRNKLKNGNIYTVHERNICKRYNTEYTQLRLKYN